MALLEKDSNLWLFEQEFYKYKKKWIDKPLDGGDYAEILNGGSEILNKYSKDEASKDYCGVMMMAFFGFIDRKAQGYFSRETK